MIFENSKQEIKNIGADLAKNRGLDPKNTKIELVKNKSLSKLPNELFTF